MSVKSTSLYFREGSSDKVYHARIEEVGGGFEVHFSYGRRGGPLTHGSKTSSPVDLAQATKIYDKLVKEKVAKGYTPDTSGAVFSGTQAITGKVASGLLPQLPNMVTEGEARALLQDDNYMLQEKIDGVNLMVAVADDGTAVGSNKKGLVVPLTKELEAAMKRYPGCTFAGELVGDTYHVFDLIKVRGRDISEKGFDARYCELVVLVINGSDPAPLALVDAASGTPAKVTMAQRIEKEGKEGFVFKLKYAPFTPGRPASAGPQLKFKLWKSASMQVIKVNTQRSVEVAVLTDCGKWRSVGSVTIPVNHSVPAVGAIVEVRYLYAFVNGGLHQPSYLGERSDIDMVECLESQLEFKAAA